MERTLSLVIAASLWTVFFLSQVRGTVAWWPFSSSGAEHVKILQDEESKQIESQPSVTPQLAKFEVATADKKFLLEAQKYMENMSPLQRCHHNVISALQRSCGEMSDEELGKVSVHLLNCQSQAEGRQVFPCDESMSLSQCTGPMDSTTWNAYHIVSNRARSVCYSVQQQRFRRQTEAAVNKLSESTIKQLLAVQELEIKHQQIKEFTEDSLQSFQSNQELLSRKQEEVMSTQVALNDHIGHNLVQLSKEKNMIQSGQVLLTSMTEEIRKQLDAASLALSEQEEGRKESHMKIVGDINTVKQNIDQVWQKVDQGTGELLSLMESMTLQYEETLHNLQLINASVSSMIALLNTMNSALTRNLDWMTSRLGGTKEGLHVLTTLAIHAAFLFLAVLCLVFVDAPRLVRVALLLIVTGNALMEIKFYWSLSTTALATFVALMLMSNWLFFCGKQHSQRLKLSPTPPGSATLPQSQPALHYSPHHYPSHSSQVNTSDDDSYILGHFDTVPISRRKQHYHTTCKKMQRNRLQ